MPDVIAVAKAMGNGHPLGAVITTREIAERYRAGGYFFSSAGGSPVSSVVGLTVLDIIRDERLQENARDTGAYLRRVCEDLGRAASDPRRRARLGLLPRARVHPRPRDVGARHRRDRCDLRRLRELGVIAQPTGDHQNILKIKPPMCFTRRVPTRSSTPWTAC